MQPHERVQDLPLRVLDLACGGQSVTYPRIADHDIRDATRIATLTMEHHIRKEIVKEHVAEHIAVKARSVQSFTLFSEIDSPLRDIDSPDGLHLRGQLPRLLDEHLRSRGSEGMGQ